LPTDTVGGTAVVLADPPMTRFLSVPLVLSRNDEAPHQRGFVLILPWLIGL
jgi:hypothetical protein